MSVVTFEQFLTEYPPGTELTVAQLVVPDPSSPNLAYLNTPDIRLECHSPECGGPRRFRRLDGGGGLRRDNVEWVFLHFICRNCHASEKTMALKISPMKGGSDGKVLKLAETPPFGPRIPSRVITLIGPDRDLFLKGWRAESQSLGIGAFGYYRRVIENQKNRLLDEIIRVGTKLGAPPEQLAELEAAKGETQFRKAIESIKHGVPKELMLEGHHNPLTLLHSALSEGLHDLSDEKCLELAHSIREVLFELVERMAEILKEQKGLKDAIARLTTKKTPT